MIRLASALCSLPGCLMAVAASSIRQAKIALRHLQRAHVLALPRAIHRGGEQAREPLTAPVRLARRYTNPDEIINFAYSKLLSIKFTHQIDLLIIF